MKLERHEACDTSITIPQSLALLTPVRIAAMSEKELQDVLPQLVSTMQQGQMSRRPEWWGDMPWTLHHLHRAVRSVSVTSLRTLVSKCYSQLMQHSKSTSTQPLVPTQPRVLDWLNSNPPNHSCTQPAKNSGIPSPSQNDGMQYLEISLCCRCNQEFSTKDTLQKHQVLCDGGGSLPLSIPSTPPSSEAPSPTAPTVPSDDTLSSGGVPSSARPPSHPVVSHKDFVAALDLVPVHRARKIRQARRRNTECETIDLEEPQTPISPPTLRTPKLLISQLSRDASTGGTGGSPGVSSRRRLSYVRQSVDKSEENEKDECFDSDGDSAESNAEDADEPKMHKKTLFSIDVSSGLGQRVLKHMTAESHVPVISNSEQFCRTPIKDKYQDRLRTRQLSYPITWKLTSKRLRQQAHCHLYNFTRAQKFEFMEKMRTGLNWRCRRLLGCVKKCRVVVRRLSMKTLRKWKPSLNRVTVPLIRLEPEVIQDWTRPKPVASSSQFLLAETSKVFKLKHKGASPHTVHTLLSGHDMSDTDDAERHLQKLTLCRGLLADSPSLPRAIGRPQAHSGSSNSPLDSPVTNMNYPTLLSILSGTSTGFKIPFHSKMAGGCGMADMKKPLKIEIPSSVTGQVPSLTKSSRSSPLDDSFSIMTVSSSDDENNRSGVCCSLCAERNRCHCSPEKTPSSATSHPSHSPAPTSRSSVPLTGTPVPPVLPSPSLQMSVSSRTTVSPPTLSPVMQASDTCLGSPVSHSFSTRRRTSSPKASPMTHMTSSACLPEEPLARCYSSLSSVTKFPEKTTSKMLKDGRERGKQQNSPLKLTLSTKNLLQPVLFGMGSASFSSLNLKESSSSKCTEDVQHVYAASVDRSRTEAAAEPGLALHSKSPSKTEAEVLVTRRGLRHTRSVAAAVGGHSIKKEGGGLGENSSFSPKQRRTYKGRSTFRDRFLDVGEEKQHCGHRTCLNQYSCNRFHKTEEKKRSNGQAVLSITGSTDRLYKPAKRVLTKADGASRTLRSSNAIKASSDAESTAGSDGSRERMCIKSLGPYPSGLQCSHSSSWGSLSAFSGEDENGVDTVPSRGMNSCSTDVTPSPSSALDTNPFLISKAQTPLFSSSVMEQARRNWSPSHKSPTGEGGALRSGNAFRFSITPPGSVSRKFDSSSDSQPDGMEPSFFSPCVYSASSPNKVTSPKPFFVFTSGSPTSLQSPTRRRLSAMQMFSVLESVKSSTPSKTKMKALKRSRVRSGHHFGGADSTGSRWTSKGLGYHTRASESATSASSTKKARLTE